MGRHRLTIIEINILTGRVLFEWRGIDRISPHESAHPLFLNPEGTAQNSSTAWDYFHLNSITKSPDSHYLISARHTSTIYKINGTSGAIIWRLGGPLSNFTLGRGVSFGGQHHARYISQSTDVDIISLFDNTGHGPEKPLSESDTSLGKIIELNHHTNSANLIQSFAPPLNHPLLAFSQGSLQTLPNNNVLINWGSEGAITEYNSRGKPLFHAFLDSGSLFDGVQNYRAFKFNWTGLPFEEPAIVALYNERKDETNVFVSWNGDTETKVWRFYSLSEKGAETRTLLGEIEREGFETRLRVEGALNDRVDAEALDEQGKVLGRTRIVAAEIDFGASRMNSDPSLLVQN
jgi:Arylsulfotransferase (ASST)